MSKPASRFVASIESMSCYYPVMSIAIDWNLLRKIYKERSGACSQNDVRLWRSMEARTSSRQMQRGGP
jgi:hypothetical protein